MKKNRVLLVEPGNEAKVIEIDNILDSYQSIVGGYIECVSSWMGTNTVIICNEEGNIKGLPFNRYIDNNAIMGTFIIAGITKDDFKSLTKKQISFLIEKLNQCNGV